MARAPRKTRKTRILPKVVMIAPSPGCSGTAAAVPPGTATPQAALVRANTSQIPQDVWAGLMPSPARCVNASSQVLSRQRLGLLIQFLQELRLRQVAPRAQLLQTPQQDLPPRHQALGIDQLLDPERLQVLQLLLQLRLRLGLRLQQIIPARLHHRAVLPQRLAVLVHLADHPQGQLRLLL